MKERNLLPLIGPVFLVVLSLALLVYVLFGGSRNAWGKIGLRIRGWDNIKTIETARQNSSKNRKMYFLGRVGDKYVRVNKIENADSEESETYVVDESIKLECLFQRKALPYPGFVSFYSEPDPHMLPVQNNTPVDGKPVKYYLFYADEKFRPCLYKTDPVRYRTILFFLYNDTKKDLYKVELFTPNGGSKDDAVIADLARFSFTQS